MNVSFFEISLKKNNNFFTIFNFFLDVPVFIYLRSIKNIESLSLFVYIIFFKYIY